MAATCMAVCKGSRKKIRGIFISSCHLPVAVECDIVILSEPGPIPQAPVGQFCRHNLSPRGDGNMAQAGSLGHAHDTTYPREGTETSLKLRFFYNFADTTYPREGTETCRKANAHIAGSLTQLIPARGRKPAPSSPLIVVTRHNLSPRGDGNPDFVALRTFAPF